MTKSMKFLCPLLLATCIVVAMPSCGTYEDDYEDLFAGIQNGNSGNNSEGDGSGNNDDKPNGSGSLTLSQVKSRAKVNVNLENYRYKITLTYPLSGNEDVSFSWAVSRRYAEEGVSITGKGINITTTTKGANKVFSLEFPIYIYYSMRADYTDPYWEKQWSHASMYLASYDALNEKVACGETLTEDEIALLNDLKSELDKMEKEVRSDLSLWLYVKINGKSYNLGERFL